ncbi:MAG: 16S rRNA (cytosine(1402)-N(4))-methyltransferase RsmH [Crocinitomicaceae bacterium]
MEINNTSYHIPVLFQESIDALDIRPDGVYVDVTFGGGGHARAIFNQLNSNGQLIVFDQDADAKKNAWEAENFHFVAANFAFLKNHLQLLRFTQVNGILADLGVSSHQFDTGERGFSIRENAPLDMRMNQNAGKSALQVINECEEHELIRIFRNYGELKNARAIAAEIVRKRADGLIETTGDLMNVLKRFAPKFKEHKFYAQVFQAVRIEVNQELQVLEEMLSQAADMLAPGGRLVVISYHSLEDRLVKNFMKRGSFSGDIEKDFFGNVQKPLTEIVRHPIVSTEEENERNPRARSAKLRIAVKNA